VRHCSQALIASASLAPEKTIHLNIAPEGSAEHDMAQRIEHMSNIEIEPSAPIIAQLNDELRRFGRGGRIVVTPGVQARGAAFLGEALEALRNFEAFDARNDPYGEHDCALIEVEGQSLLWKIDYYDTSLTLHSPDPADASVTCRVLTLMLADEY
jgi:hypothetical protein